MASRRRPDQQRGSGDQQTAFEALICLVLREHTDSLLIGVDEQAALYAAYPRGFGLLVARALDGAIHVKITGETSQATVEEYQQQLEHGITPSSLNEFMGAQIVAPDDLGRRSS